MEDWINIHTHQPGEGINIVDTCLGTVSLPRNGVVYYSQGIHPLFIDESAEAKLQKIEQAAASKTIVAIGETGIDRRSATSIEKQQTLFECQAAIAVRYKLPVIIHNVRAISEIIVSHKKCASPANWIIHGFDNRREILQDLLRHGFYISVGRQVMNQESNAYILLPEVPTNRLFIETDDSAWTISELYYAVAQRKGIAVEELQQMIRTNFNKLFQI